MHSTLSCSQKYLIFTLALLLSGCVTDTRDRFTTDRVDPLFREYQGDDKPGAAVSIIHKGAPIVTKTYGMANLEENLPVKSETNFRLASVTKQFTALCIMLLVERDSLSYSSTLKDIFPEFPEYGSQITVQHLLQHQSGLIAYEDLIAADMKVQVHDSDVLQLMKNETSTYFQPGTDYRYSNSGYAVLAMIIEKISEKSFAEFLQENVFAPIEMNNSVAFENGKSTVLHRAYGYSVEADSIYRNDQSITSAVLGDGGIYSSLDDLFRWDQALYTELLVSKESMQHAFTPALSNYGFGWRIDNYKGHSRVHHTGSTRGFRIVISRFPDDEFTVIILTNRNGPAVSQIADELTDIFLIE